MNMDTYPSNIKESDALQNILIDTVNFHPENISPTKKAIKITNPLELTWENLNIFAYVNHKVKADNGKLTKVNEKKQILKDLSGSIKPGNFTAILGPSGSGKTTLLNFLSGRLVANNMEIEGSLYLNGQKIDDMGNYSNQIAYVMQDDILLATFTPYEAFKFSADMRLKDISEDEKIQKVKSLIKLLGLEKCKDTKVGNAIIRGISGGERKRTSIGVELLTNPSILFLDEPTTGLDSITSLNVIELLKKLSHIGVNVISTIHQPSSEIFVIFERLILICEGKIIYQGIANQAVEYFNQQNLKCPDFSNPADYFMKIMNEEGLIIEYLQKGNLEISDEQINKEFKQRLEKMVTIYKQSDQIKDLKSTYNQVPTKNDNRFNVSVIKQFSLLFKRCFITQVRNPMDLLLKTIQIIVFSIATIIVFNPLGDGQAGIQNRNGALFFISTMSAFSSIQGSISTFQQDRGLFLRERLNKSYTVGAYFWGKSLSELPFHIYYPIIQVAMTYYAIGLNNNDAKYFFILAAAMICTYFYGVSYGLFISVIVPKMEIAMALIPILVIPFMVLGGLYVNTNNIPDFLKWIEYLSMFKYGYQAAALNEFDNLNFECINPITQQQCNPKDQLGFRESIAENFYALIGLGLCFRLLAYIFMHIISQPKRPKLNQKLKQ
ncbi:hypothetical protein IMG5_067050 [Ichthyophthirius multifiliis]|uniref:ABC transporter domain-containing protein n=1 Tax=Ichthyophthirius multifiliis TaxID=5932 RepID=G0QPE0_ICHMU|nr:hypothetical protein IMG5_067050 [Ichthyophthirius multifiliis]EGR32908.1 hypothetical protein IMG5_067050 [Ichthyophthirius multifiliis]|eukprot:XP_004036894.1 hypothetical protein IMG5_067050 [Ichthyophthirius multifiliis]